MDRLIVVLAGISPEGWSAIGTGLLLIVSELLPFFAKITGNGILHALAEALKKRSDQ
jgi:hypothetical protein